MRSAIPALLLCTLLGACDVSGPVGSNRVEVASPSLGRRGVSGKQVIVFTSHRDTDAEVYIMHPDGSAQSNVTSFSGANDNQAAISPDGSRIVFVTVRHGIGNAEIYTSDLDGSDLDRLTTNGDMDVWPTWSPDGSQIAFISNRDGDNDLFVMNVDGLNQTNISNTTAHEWSPDWSPDGTQIVFSSNRSPGDLQIYLTTPDGMRGTRLTNTFPDNWSPRWSPDGSEILFVSSRDDPWGDVWVMDQFGTNQRRLTTYAGPDGDPDCSPDGTQIVFSSGRHFPPRSDLHHAPGRRGGGARAVDRFNRR